MPVDAPVSDTSRAKMHDPSMEWPESVAITMTWIKENGRKATRTQIISADQFYGRGSFGAPVEGQALIAAIDRMRRLGPPKPIRKGQRQQS
jgi:hypothetical protein